MRFCSLLCAISLPYLSGIDVARVHFRGSAVGGGSTSQAINQVRVRVVSPSSLAYQNSLFLVVRYLVSVNE
jgi:hypothetical protein